MTRELPAARDLVDKVVPGCARIHRLTDSPDAPAREESAALSGRAHLAKRDCVHGSQRRG